MSDRSERLLQNLEIRPATICDIPEILRQRRAMYEDMEFRDDTTLTAMASVSAGYMTKAFTDGSFRAWLALTGDRVVGGGAIVISPWPAHPNDLVSPGDDFKRLHLPSISPPWRRAPYHADDD